VRVLHELTADFRQKYIYYSGILLYTEISLGRNETESVCGHLESAERASATDHFHISERGFFMFKKMKKALPIAIAGVFAAASVAWGTSVGVTGGSLFIGSSTDKLALSTGNPLSGAVSSGINFDTLGTIDVTKTLSSGMATDYLLVADNRGTNAGFVAKVSASSLTATVPDSTSAGNFVNISIPADRVLTVSAGSLTPLFGSKPLAQAHVGTQSVGSSAVNLLSVNKGVGTGAFLTTLNYTLTLPNYLPAGSLVSATSPSSAFKNVTDTNVTNLGLFAGTYNTTVTYSITTAP
jgi:hypothetical protein